MVRHQFGWQPDQGRGSTWRPAHDHRYRVLPVYTHRMGDPSGRSIIAFDNRGNRFTSPSQHEHPSVIQTNGEAGINRATEPNQVPSSNTGVYLTLYLVVMTNTHKLTVALSFDVPEKCICGHCDDPSGRVLAHSAFQPFDWPQMTDQSPPYFDFKVKVLGRVLIHLIM